MRLRWLPILAIGAASLAGCAGKDAPVVPFATAQGGAGPVTIEGVPDTSTMRKETGQPTEFLVTERESSQILKVSAPPEVSVPANLTSATYVSVIGTYDTEKRAFVATRVETKVPPREEQPRG